MSVDLKLKAQWNLTGWSLINLVRLQASWKEIVVSSSEERLALEGGMAEVDAAIQVQLQQREKV